jgi:hypothetical protein
MKKKVLVSALVLVLLIGVGIGAYLFYDYNENKPLILKCTISDPPAASSTVILRIGSIHGFPGYWNFAEEEWVFIHFTRRQSFTIDKNRFSWIEGDYLGEGKKTVIDRNSGDYSVSFCEKLCVNDLDFDVVIEKGNCVKSAEPAKTLKQKF